MFEEYISELNSVTVVSQDGLVEWTIPETGMADIAITEMSATDYISVPSFTLTDTTGGYVAGTVSAATTSATTVSDSRIDDLWEQVQKLQEAYEALVSGGFAPSEDKEFTPAEENDLVDLFG